MNVRRIVPKLYSRYCGGKSSVSCCLFFIFLFIHLFISQLNNPDIRVVLLKDFVKKNFPVTPLLDYALQVEKITTSKVKLQKKKVTTQNFSFNVFISGRDVLPSSDHSLTFLTQSFTFPLPLTRTWLQMLSVGLFIVETKLDPKRRWLHRNCVCGFVASLWRLYEVSFVLHSCLATGQGEPFGSCTRFFVVLNDWGTCSCAFVLGKKLTNTCRSERWMVCSSWGVPLDLSVRPSESSNGNVIVHKVIVVAVAVLSVVSVYISIYLLISVILYCYCC